MHSDKQEWPGLRVSAAAWRDGEGNVISLPAPARHGDVIVYMVDKLGYPKPIYDGPRYTSGFVLTDGRFVDRREAKQVAWAANQILVDRTLHDDLYTENLW